ncbi:MAG: hypothetical protein K2N14_02905, partial [Clostridia bacterium]|nr:hypothetical protein [Clostridia bacterium]
VYSWEECTGYKNLPVISLVVNGLLFIALIVFENGYKVVYEFYFHWLWIAFIAFVIVIPVLCWTLKRGKLNEKKAK